MAVSNVWTLFAICITICFHLTQSSVYHVVSSLDQDCPADTQACITLFNFSTNFMLYTNSEGNENFTLVFLPGNHNLETQITFTNHSNVSMVKSTNASQPVIITCNNDANFEFIELNSLRVVGLTFVGCAGIRVESVHLFTMEQSLFEGQNVGSALKLNRVTAIIFDSYFNSCKGESIIYFVTCCLDTGFEPYTTTLTVGGAIVVNHSQLVIHNSEFRHNKADIGGVIFSVGQSNISIISSNFINNRASFDPSSYRYCFCGGGALHSDDTSRIYINNSRFTGNSALKSGGVLSVVGTDTSVAITDNNTFTNNSAGQDGGVVSVYPSNSSITLTVSNSDMMNNSAVRYGGVVSISFSEYISNSSIIFTATDCHITRNKALFGGVVGLYSDHSSNSNFSLQVTGCDIVNNDAVFHGGFLILRSHANSTKMNFVVTIISSNFMDNVASSRGGVISVHSTSVSTLETLSLTISDSKFRNNTSNFRGGVVAVYQQLANGGSYMLSITNSEFIHNSASNTDGGGVVFVSMYQTSQTKVVVNVSDNCTFESNGIQSTDGVVGALLSVTSPDSSLAVYIADSEIKHNGGVVRITVPERSTTSGFSIDILITDSEVIGNHANHGSVLYILLRNSENMRLTAEISNSKIISNSAAQHGTLYISDSNTDTSNLEIMLSLKSSNFTNNTALNGGVVSCRVTEHIMKISMSCFENNQAVQDGGVLYLINGDNVEITNSKFISNYAGGSGGVAHTSSVRRVGVTESQFSSNSAGNTGGVIASIGSTINIAICSFTYNSVDTSGKGGVLNTQGGHLLLELTNFTSNGAAFGGVLWMEDATLKSNFLSTIFDGNLARVDGGVIYSERSSTSFIGNTFLNNRADNNGGTMFMNGESTLIKYTTFFNNSAGNDGGVIRSYLMDNATIEQCNFTKNEAKYDGGVIHAEQCDTFITETLFDGNKADAGGVMRAEQGNTFFNKSTLVHNNASAGGVIWAKRAKIFSTVLNVTRNKGKFCVMHLLSSEYLSSSITYSNNEGSIFAQNSFVHVNGNSSLTNSMQLSRATNSINRLFEGGALTAFQSKIVLSGICVIQDNRAIKGGAINAIQSEVEIHGLITLTDNKAMEAGGGIRLYHSELMCKDNSTLILQKNTGNDKGGGIMAVSSIIKVNVEASNEMLLVFDNNFSNKGGGLYFEMSSSLLILKFDANTTHSEIVIFYNNSASYGGAIYVSDDGMCSLTNVDECPFQALAMYGPIHVDDDTADTRCKNVLSFSDNMASVSGEDLFGGLLDRCTVSMFAEPNINNVNMDFSSSNGTVITKGYEYLTSISNILETNIDSDPIRVCFCREGYGQPDCDYQPQPIVIKKGQQRNISLSLSVVDQISKPLKEAIIVSHFESGNYVCQNNIQNSDGKCTKVDFAVESDNVTEELIISVGEGPCENTEKSQARITLHYECDDCPIGFERDKTIDNCHCDCDSQLWPHFTNCSGYLLVRESNVWVTYINISEDFSHYQYLIHPYCPYDYCHDLDAMVTINLSEPLGADAQCISNRAGLMCGKCAHGFSLSIGSSRCVTCPKLWPLVTVGITIGSIIGGIAFVALLLILNLTVAIGTLNGIILYANIVGSNSSIFFPSTVSKYIAFCISWLNLEQGFDSCFFDGMDAYWKTLLHLLFPFYIIFIVAMVIVVSEYSPRFARIIGKRNPIATLATLILFSYGMLLRSVISSMSFTVLNYPGDTHQLVWLPDASVTFLSGKHVYLFVIALLILLTGLVYTVLLMFWQLFLRLPNKKWFSLLKYQKLCHFIEPYHAPYKFQHRYWTGLLLLVRVIVYVVTATHVSENRQFPLLVIIVCFGCLLLLKGVITPSLYKKWWIDFLEVLSYFNIVSFAAFTLYYQDKVKDQEVVAHISVTFTLFLLLCVLVHHMYEYTSLHSLIKCVLELLAARMLKKDKGQPAADDSHVPQQINNTSNNPHVEVTYTEIELTD